jgi:5-methylcytosine-specific restriction protein A
VSHLRRRTEERYKRPKRKDPHQTHRWHSYSRQFLKRPENRLCVQCKKEGKVILSQCTDHIIPISAGGSMWDSTNHQALCNSCHSKKTVRENPGWNKG